MAVLTSILPPMAPVGRTASAGSSVDTTIDLSTSLPATATATAKEELAPRSAFATGSPVADTRARLPSSRPFAAAQDVAIAQTYVRIGTLNAPLRSDERAKLRRRALSLLLAVVLAVVGTALFFAVGYGALDRFLPATLHAGPPALSFVGPGLFSVVGGANRR